jgi:hypothetical protein
MPGLEHRLGDIKKTVFCFSLHLEQVSKGEHNPKLFSLVRLRLVGISPFKHNVALVDVGVDSNKLIRVIAFKHSTGSQMVHKLAQQIRH